jgi:hypothetical protein
MSGQMQRNDKQGHKKAKKKRAQMMTAMNQSHA